MMNRKQNPRRASLLGAEDSALLGSWKLLFAVVSVVENTLSSCIHCSLDYTTQTHAVSAAALYKFLGPERLVLILQSSLNCPSHRLAHYLVKDCAMDG